MLWPFSRLVHVRSRCFSTSAGRTSLYRSRLGGTPPGAATLAAPVRPRLWARCGGCWRCRRRLRRRGDGERDRLRRLRARRTQRIAEALMWIARSGCGSCWRAAAGGAVVVHPPPLLRRGGDAAGADRRRRHRRARRRKADALRLEWAGIAALVIGGHVRAPAAEHRAAGVETADGRLQLPHDRLDPVAGGAERDARGQRGPARSRRAGAGAVRRRRRLLPGGPCATSTCGSCASARATTGRRRRRRDQLARLRKSRPGDRRDRRARRSARRALRRRRRADRRRGCSGCRSCSQARSQPHAFSSPPRAGRPSSRSGCTPPRPSPSAPPPAPRG